METIVGKWFIVSSNGELGELYYHFFDDGTFETILFDDKNNSFVDIYGRYSVAKSSLSLSFVKVAHTATLGFSISGDILTLQPNDGGNTIKLKKKEMPKKEKWEEKWEMSLKEKEKRKKQKELQKEQKELQKKRRQWEEFKKQRQQWMEQGLCDHCGGQIVGWFIRKCKACGNRKNY